MSHQPAGRPVTGTTARPASVQFFQRGIGSRGELAVGGQRIVDVGENANDATSRVLRKTCNGLHGAAPSVKDARRAFHSASVGQRSAWMARNSA